MCQGKLDVLQRHRRARADDDALGLSAAPGRAKQPARHQHRQHRIELLASLDELGNRCLVLWRPWMGTRSTKADAAKGEHELFAFLTCAPNAVVAPVHPKAMPVILTTAAECDA